MVKSPFSYGFIVETNVFLWFFRCLKVCFLLIFLKVSGRSSPTALRPRGKWRSWRFRPRPQFSMRSDGFHNDFMKVILSDYMVFCAFKKTNRLPSWPWRIANVQIAVCYCPYKHIHKQLWMQDQSGKTMKKTTNKYTCTSCTIADHQNFPDLDRFCPKHYLRHHFR